jgi:hypothetical protein
MVLLEDLKACPLRRPSVLRIWPKGVVQRSTLMMDVRMTGLWKMKKPRNGSNFVSV